MDERQCDVAIIGAGTAGLKAWKAATTAGASVIVIDDSAQGSTCTAVGCMPSKLLIAAGRAAKRAREAGLFGIAVAGVSVDGPAVLTRLRRERDDFDRSVREIYEGIPAADRIDGTARFTAPGVLAVGDRQITAKTVIIATGSAPTVPPPLQPLGDLVHTNDTIFEIADLPRRMAVVGAGALGLELAQAFARLGVEVTVLDKSDTVGNLADPEAEQVARAGLEQDLTIHLGIEIEAERHGDNAVLRWTGDSNGSVEVDLVLAAAGRKPRLEDLDLKAAGLPLDDEGVPCFDHPSHRTDDPQVYIAGDAGGWRPVLHEASRGGLIAGTLAAGGGDAPPQTPKLQIAFTEPNMVQVGTGFASLPDDAAIATARSADNGRARVDGDPDGIVRLYADKDGKLLGGTIVANGGEHLGQSLAIAVELGCSASQLADLPWYHPTLEEMLQQAARCLPGGNPTGA